MTDVWRIECTDARKIKVYTQYEVHINFCNLGRGNGEGIIQVACGINCGKLKLLQRFIILFGELLSWRLLTTVMLAQKHVPVIRTCYNGEEETIMHVLFTCPFAFSVGNTLSQIYSKGWEVIIYVAGKSVL